MKNRSTLLNQLINVLLQAGLFSIQIHRNGFSSINDSLALTLLCLLLVTILDLLFPVINVGLSPSGIVKHRLAVGLGG